MSGSERWECPNCGHEFENESAAIGTYEGKKCIMCENTSPNAGERALSEEADGLVMWMDGDVSPENIHAVIEYLSGSNFLSERGERFSRKFWEEYLHTENHQRESP